MSASLRPSTDRTPPSLSSAATTSRRPLLLLTGAIAAALAALAPDDGRGITPAAAARPAAATFKRLDRATEEQLLEQLAAVPEYGLGLTGMAVVRSYIATYGERIGLSADPDVTELSPLLQAFPAARQLPYKNGAVTQLTPKQGHTLDTLSRKLRVYLATIAPPDKDGRRRVTKALRERLLNEMQGKRPEWLRAEALPTLLQMLMHEDTEVRHLLVDLLALIPGKASTEGLARRAVFDLDAGVRQAAVDGLRTRSDDDYEPLFLKALRYPWPPAAEHAAEALVALQDTRTVPTLVTLLKEPDPAGPQLVARSRSAVVQELVRTKHVANCLLCHPPSLRGDEAVLGVDPVFLNPSPGSPPPSTVTGRPGAHSYDGSSDNGRPPAAVPLLIRGDVTYLRQDFSVQLATLKAAANVAPARARFDYVLRSREATSAERKQLRTSAGEPRDYPQREAVLFALRELTGQDAGRSTAAWQDLFPEADNDVAAARLCREVLKANPIQQEVLLTKFRDGKKLVDTLALARAAAELKGGAQDKAREFLVQRLTRMTAKTLRDKLEDDDREVRRAAVLASARAEKKELVPDLIALLDANDSEMTQVASAGLRQLTKRDFATPGAWRAWWRQERVESRSASR